MNTIFKSSFINSKEIFTIVLSTNCSTSIRRSSDGLFHISANNLEPCLVKIIVKPESEDPLKAPMGIIDVDHIGEPPTDKGNHIGRIAGTTTISAGRYEFDVFGNPTHFLDNGKYLSYEIYLERFTENGNSGFEVYNKHILTTPSDSVASVSMRTSG